MRLLDSIQLLLLISREQRPDLRHRAVHDPFRFLHRLLMNSRQPGRLQFFFRFLVLNCVPAKGAWHRRSYTQNCNQSAPVAVIATGVDALSITWIILTQVRLFMLRSSMTMRRLARWCDSF